MKIEFKIQAIFDNLNNLSLLAKEAIEEIKRQKTGDGELLSVLNDVHGDINNLGPKLKKIISSNVDEYNILDFFNRALSVEYNGIFDYQRFAASIEDSHLRKRLYEFGLMEMEHASLLAEKVSSMGGMPRLTPPEFMNIESLTIEEILKQHKEGELKAITLFEEGLKQIVDPELNWFIGRLKLDEIEHLKELDGLLKEYKDLKTVVKVSSRISWHDDYVDNDDERPWIEG